MEDNSGERLARQRIREVVCSRCCICMRYIPDEGTLAHIESSKKDGPRYNPNVDKWSFDNLMWLCRPCHNKIDGRKTCDNYSVEFLKLQKQKTIQKINHLMNKVSNHISRKIDLKTTAMAVHDVNSIISGDLPDTEKIIKIVNLYDYNNYYGVFLVENILMALAYDVVIRNKEDTYAIYNFLADFSAQKLNTDTDHIQERNQKIKNIAEHMLNLGINIIKYNNSYGIDILVMIPGMLHNNHSHPELTTMFKNNIIKLLNGQNISGKLRDRADFAIRYLNSNNDPILISRLEDDMYLARQQRPYFR